MKLSARNQIKGKVVEVRKGATTSHVRIDIGNGVVITSSITNEAVDDLAILTRLAALGTLSRSAGERLQGIQLKAPLLHRGRGGTKPVGPGG
jgi:molybdopterin-binding protein